MQRPVKATTRQRQPKNGPVEVRNMLNLPDRMRAEALAAAGNDATRVIITGPCSYYVIDPVVIPEEIP